MKANDIGAMVAVLLAGWMGGTVQADTLYWDGSDTITAGAQGGTGTWNANSVANWWDGTVSANVIWPNSGTDNDAVFGGTAGTVHISGVTANDLAFNTTDYILSIPSALTLNGTTPTITTGAGVSTTIRPVIAGSSGLTKSGTGTLTLSGANTYTGVTTVNAGTLVAGSSAAFGQAANLLDPYYDEVYIGTAYQGARSLSETGTPWIWRLSQTQFDVFWNTPGHGQNYPYTGYVPDSNPNLYYYLMEDMGWQPGGGDKDFWDIMYKIETDGFNYKITCVVGFTGYLHNFYVTTGGVKNIIWADCFHHNGESVVVNGIGAGSLTFGANSTGKVQLNGNNITMTGLNTTAPIFTPIIESGSDTPGTDTLTLDARPTSDGDVNNSTYAGVMQDGSTRKLALVKNGTGWLKLSGNNTYTGPTNVNAGTLLVNGTHTGGGTYTIASTATLGGTGTVGSPVIVQSGGHLAPGASVGDLHVGSLAVPGSVIMSANSIYDWELGDTSADKVDIMGDLTLDPGWRLKLVDVGGTPQASNRYDLFTFTGTFSGTFAGVIDASGVSWDITYAVICLENTPVGGRVYITNLPEPATLSLLALLALSLPKRGGLTLLRRKSGCGG